MGRLLDLVYGLGLVAASPWLLRGRRAKGPTDWPGRFGKGPALPGAGGRPRVLIHAVSLGEVNLIRMLVDKLEQAGIDVVVASTTHTGFDRAVQLFGDERVVRYPFDFTRAIDRLLDRVQPQAVVTVELEVWPNLVERCTRRGLPVAVVNGRLSDRSIRGYRRMRPLLRRTFAGLAAVGAQTQAYAERFVEMGVLADRVSVLDTMKWDTAQVANEVTGADELAKQIGLDLARPVVVLGSTGVGEESPLIKAMQPTGQGAQILVVPRKPERFDEVARELGEPPRRSREEAIDDRGLYLIDTLGELRKAYALADVVIVGRSFNGWGGSDPIEPVALGRPTIIGPDHQNFGEVVAMLREGGGLEVAPDLVQAADRARRLLTDVAAARSMADAGRGVILSRQGATERYVALVQDLLRKR